MDSGASIYSRLTFRIRLVLALVFLSLLVAAIAGVALFGLINLRGFASHVYNDSEQSRLANEIVVEALLCRRYEKDFFLNSGNITAQSAPLQQWNDASFELLKAIKAYEKDATTDRDLKRAQAWHAVWSQYTHGFGVVEIAINVGEIKSPKDALTTFEPYQGSIQAMTDEAIGISQQKTASAEQAWKDLETAGDNNTWLVAIIAGLVFFVSVVWSLLFPNWLIRPIQVLQQAAVRIAGGDLTTRADLKRHDELGVLGQSFDHMAAIMQRNTADLEAQYVNADLARTIAEEANAKIIDQLAMIEQQQAVIDEMSVPILPLTDRALVMPLVGALDHKRIALVQERVLRIIQESSARQFLLDITGVPIVDMQVASGLMQIAQSARLLGCKVILVGIRPEVAQAIVSLGISMVGIETFSTLQNGIVHALRQSESGTRLSS